MQGERPVYTGLRAALSEALDAHFPGWREGGPRIACESGRYLVCDSGSLLAAVVNTRTAAAAGSRSSTPVSTPSAGCPASAASCRCPWSPTRRARHRPAGRARRPAVHPGDVLGRDVGLPDPAPGDVVTIPNAGAYGPTASLLMFLGRPAPAEVVVRGAEVVSVSRIEHIRTYELGQAL
ncbi:hypothetical protein NKH77_06105 [Streptomyces sp. M19]